VVARGSGDHAAGTDARVESHQGMDRAAKLERAGALKDFELPIHASVSEFIQPRQREARRGLQISSQESLRLYDLFVYQHIST
jgi:hypothetical protein